jgi:hypothetical protein
LDVGDKYFTYRGVPNMFLHVYRWGELRRELHTAGFEIIQRIPLDSTRRGLLRAPWLMGNVRANGWIVVCR